MSATISAGLAEFLAGTVRRARRRYRKRLARCRRKFSEKAVHDLRVEMRRSLALLDLLQALQPAPPLKKLAKQFKKRLDLFGELRDLHVQLRLLKPLWPEFKQARGLKRLLSRREEKLAARLAGKIQAAKFTRLTAGLKYAGQCLERARLKRSRSHSAPAAAALRGAFRQAITWRRAVRRDNPATIHCLRVAFKRFRYMSELLKPLLPHVTTARLEGMKEYQAAAGNIQDLEVLLATLAGLVRDRELDAGDVKLLRDELLRRRREAINYFMARVDDLSEFENNFAPQP